MAYTLKIRMICYRLHLNNTHGVPLTCENCDYAAPTRPDLIRHQNEAHLGIVYLSCSECDFETKNEAELDRHK